ncbi:MAG: hypothetical protein IKL53_00950 [Lachnospiraceae bacterium]|nr:hypothetical protein [Lachnospiraceae bacterium]
MEKMVALEMFVDKTIANEIREKGLAEIALRRADAKFKAMVKCKLAGPTDSDNVLPEKLKSVAMYLSEKNSIGLESVRNTLISLNKGTNKLTEATKNIAMQVDGIYSLTNSVMNISYLNTGLSLANTAIDVAGFMIVTDKLNDLNTEVKEVSNKLNKIANMQKNEKIAICQKLIMRCNAVATKIRDNDEVDLDKLEDLIMEIRAYLSEMIMNLHDEALGEEIVLNIIYTMMPAYTALFHEFLRRYYFQKHMVPVNYDMFLSLYGELEGESFIQRLQDYYFIKEKLHTIEVLDVLNTQTLLGLNGLIQIEDQLSILKTLGNEEKITLFENGLKRYAKNRIKEVIPILAKEAKMVEEDCEKY